MSSETETTGVDVPVVEVHTPSWRWTLLKWVLVLLLPLALICAFYVCRYAVYWPAGTISKNTAHTLQFDDMFVWLFAVFCFIVSSVLLFGELVFWLATKSVRTGRRILFTFLFCLGSFVSSCSPFMFRVDFVKTFTPVAERGQVIIDAVEAFHRDRGVYPEHVEDFVPAYLKEMPKTGLTGYPDYQYSKGDATAPYVISVNTPTGGLNWDQFIFWPTGNYDKQEWGGWIEPVGKWVYFHE